MRRPLITATAVLAIASASAGLFAQPVQARAQHADKAPLVLAANDDNSRLFSLLQDMQDLQQQVRKMRGEIQTLQHQIKRNQDSQQRMYQDLDERVKKLEGGSEGSNEQVSEADIKQAYLDAFDLLRDGKYNDAIGGFEQFLEKYPDNSYTNNALYWLGQARYVQGDLSGAMDALQKLEKEYPDSSKLPSALFRMGVIQQTEGKTDKAKALFKQVIKTYPDSDSAGMAKERLQKIG